MEREEALAPDSGCQKCGLYARPRARVCTPPVRAERPGEGTLLIVGEAPSKDASDAFKPFAGVAAMVIKDAIKNWWTGGPVVLDNAVKCFPGRDMPKDSISSCRGYLAATVQDAAPSRIIALGAGAALSLTGRTIAPLSARRGYTYTASGVPLFFVIHPLAATRNRFIKQWWDADMRWALTTPDPPKPPTGATVRLVQDADDAEAAVAEMYDAAAEGRWIAFDCETMGYMHTSGFRIVSMSFCVEGEDDSWAWPREMLAHWTTEGRATSAPLMRMLADPRVKKVGQNVKYDCQAVRCHFGMPVKGIVGDTRLWRKLLFSDADADLESIAELVGMGGHKDEAHAALKVAIARIQGRKVRKSDDELLVDSVLEDAADGLIPPEVEAAVRMGAEPKKYAFGFLPKGVLNRYCARDTVSTARAGVKLEGELRALPEIHRIWERLVLPASVAIEQIEAWGIYCNPAAVAKFKLHLETRLMELQDEFDAYPQLNPNSPKSVAAFLYGPPPAGLGLPPFRVTDKGNPSTDEESLDAIAHLHPVAKALKDWRMLTKFLGTYALGFIEHTRADGRVHPNLNLDGARSGRLSCSEPNLQNIPRAKGSPEGRMARDCFQAPPGYVLLEADYSQLELRIAAMLSGDKKMQAIFASGVDYHQRTAEMVSKTAWGIEPHEVTEEHRALAKPINFGILYGQGDEALAANAGCSKLQARRIREAILGEFKDLARWIKGRLAESQRTGVARTWWEGQPARCRSLHLIADHDDARRVVAEHSSWNTPIQGTSSDFCLASVAAVVQWILAMGLEDRVKLVLTVHDSILLEVREDWLSATAKKVHEIMTGWDSADVPLVADFKAGGAWGSLKKYDALAGAYAEEKKAA